MPAPSLPTRRTVLAALAISANVAARPGHGVGVTLTIDHTWTRPAPIGANGAGYLAITNRGTAADTLLFAASAEATAVSIHESRMVGQVMTMRGLKSLPIPAGATVSLRPGGLHLMFERLTRPLKVGEEVPAVLTFARAGRLRVHFLVAVGPAGAAMPGM